MADPSYPSLTCACGTVIQVVRNGEYNSEESHKQMDKHVEKCAKRKLLGYA